MKIITFENIKKLDLSPRICYEWVSEMIEKKNTCDLPPKISMHPMEGCFCNYMPCILGDKVTEERFGGIKIVNRYPERRPSLDSKLLLMDMNTGDFLALMDANWITAMRTGAVATHSILKFAKTDFSVVAMLGLGNTARATLLVLTSVLENKKMTVKLLKYKGQEKLFEKRFKECKNLSFVFVDTYQELMKGSDVIISCATFIEQDLCTDEFYDEGVLVVPVHTRGFTNCDLFFDKVYADDYGHVCQFKNFDKFKYFAEVCDVVNGNAVGRENDRERILAYNIGVAIHDIYYAYHIFEMLKNREDLMEIEMKIPTDKFWV